MIDLSLFEPLFSVLGPQITEFSELGVVQGRQGNRSPRTAPRNAYQTSDGRWVALSGGTQQIVNRMLEAIERPELAEDPRFSDSAARRANADEIDAIVADWIAGHTLEEVLAAFEAVERPDRAGLRHRPDLTGPALPRAREASSRARTRIWARSRCPASCRGLSRTPGRIRFNGPTKVGADTEAVLGEVRGRSADATAVSPRSAM